MTAKDEKIKILEEQLRLTRFYASALEAAWPAETALLFRDRCDLDQAAMSPVGMDPVIAGKNAATWWREVQQARAEAPPTRYAWAAETTGEVNRAYLVHRDYEQAHQDELTRKDAQIEELTSVVRRFALSENQIERALGALLATSSTMGILLEVAERAITERRDAEISRTYAVPDDL